MIDRAGLARWLAEYVAAWRSRDRERIVDLFADAAHYRYRPHEQPVVGSQRIADDWLEIDDPPGSFDAAYAPVAIDGDTAVASGSTTYTHPDGSIKAVYDNLFVLRFDEAGRCVDLVEWFVKRPERADA